MNHTQQIKEIDGEYTGAMIGYFNPDELAPVENLDAGAVFVYMFRRFGYPKHGWDNQKTLVKWILTTDMKGVFLEVQPNVTGAGTFGYMLRDDIGRACMVEESKPSYEWYERFEAWTVKTKHIETIHMHYEPDPEKLNRVWQTWTKAHEINDFDSDEAAEHVFFNDQEKITRELQDEYKLIEPHPKRIKIDNLPDSSLLKQCQNALRDAIADLWTPVAMRDVALCIDGKPMHQTEDTIVIDSASPNMDADAGDVLTILV